MIKHFAVRWDIRRKLYQRKPYGDNFESFSREVSLKKMKLKAHFDGKERQTNTFSPNIYNSAFLYRIHTKLKITV